ncbi:MAG: biotin--[acetyl-CoA-carboxylase] ligase [Bacteroidetes bacterium]|nr:biotin--[acetyl-CoA-carboxylase] ligase [Bacteroidota bacterium]
MKTLFVGQNSIHLKSVDSTNSYASELLRQISLPDGTLFYTFDQQNGRGQRGNSWESEPSKNVALSYILHAKFLAPNKQFLLTKTVSLAVADVMTDTLKKEGIQADVKIKWPNDIYVNGNKIAGILIENILKDNTIQHSIIGIGININQTEFKTTSKATSLKILIKKEQSKEMLLELLSSKLEAYYLKLKSNRISDLDAAYLKQLYQFETPALYETDSGQFIGTLSGVSETGKLQIIMGTGIREFDLKEIRFI